ncbi:RNA polymerase sigma factor [Hymenobacter coccineus]|uniref:RNA polymerase subunit sigma-70 n=1 Tax=Hymenobacter coccineus TaxID=1908235 RepID=A0A1G1TJI0_9BACT|nr:sigma-70 family RNA polymerase sigma factor [Hymenobacter coccineus]OGX91013.1 hypothetical protein BEN49_21400 [Hymenobacter coccineus]
MLSLTPAAEARLVHRLLARDARAMRGVYDHYAPALLAALHRLVGDPQLAQDVLQDGLLKAWLHIAGYDPARGRLYTWLVRLCANHALDVVRSPRHRFHRDAHALEAAGAQQAAAPVAFNPDHLDVRAWTQRLRPRQREVLELFYFQGFTQTEIAARVGVPVATVKTRARAGLRALARYAR